MTQTVKELGSAQEGVAHWKAQRVSAVALIPLGIWFVLAIATQSHDYHQVLAWAAQPWISAALALFVGTAFYHSYLGLRTVIEDYVPSFFWRAALSLKVQLVSLALAVLSWFFIICIAIKGASL
jgi:succinate dehydrogenase / fumarate reductase membrane anchor subunit